MTWLDNPVANMHGPHFLLLYTAVAAVGLSALWFLLRRDSTAGEPAPPVPSDPDPYAVAYLRGGLREVTLVAMCELLQRRYLECRRGVFKKAKKAPGFHHLQGIPQVVYKWFKAKKKRQAREFFASTELSAALRDQVEPTLRQPLEAERLLATRETKHYRLGLTVAAMALLLGLGGYKLTVALNKGYTNVFFLVLLLAATLVATVVISARAPYATTRGRKYLDTMNLAFQQLTNQPATARGSFHLLLIALSGTSALAGTSNALQGGELGEFQHTASSGDGYFSAIWGGSCSGGGGSGGGGCGGCGGE